MFLGAMFHQVFACHVLCGAYRALKGDSVWRDGGSPSLIVVPQFFLFLRRHVLYQEYGNMSDQPQKLIVTTPSQTRFTPSLLSCSATPPRMYSYALEVESWAI